MEARDIHVGQDYELLRRWSGRRRVRILEKKGYGFWRARYVRDKYSCGTPGDEVQVESRELYRPWAEARSHYEQQDLIAREWERATKRIEEESEGLVSELSEFDVELEYTDTDREADGLPGETMVYLALPAGQLERLVGSLKQGEIQEPKRAESALSQLI